MILRRMPLHGLPSGDARVALLLYVANLLAQLLMLRHPPDAFFYNLDELNLTFSCIDRFLGLPSTVLTEPSTPLQMLAVPIFLLHHLTQCAPHCAAPDPLSAFARYLADAYADPRSQVLLLRAVVAVLGSLGPSCAFLICRRMGATTTNALLAGLVLSVQPALVEQSLMVSGDAPALSAVLAAVLMIQDRVSPVRAFFAGVMFALAVTFKLSLAGTLLVLLAFVGAAAAGSWRRVTGELAALAGGIVIGLLLLLPQTWTEPLRVVKTVLGNVGKPGSHADFHAFVTGLIAAQGWFFVLFSAGALALGVSCCVRRQEPRRLLVGLMVAYGAMLVPLLTHATTVYPRYFLGLCVPIILIFVRVLRDRPWASGVSLAVVTVASALTMLAVQRIDHSPDALVTALRHMPQLPAASRIYLPEAAATTYLFRLPQSTYRRVSAHTRAELEDQALIQRFLSGRGLPQAAARILVTDFNEREQANAARTAAAAEMPYHVSPDVDMYLYRTDPSDRTSWAGDSWETAVDDYRHSPSTALLIETQRATALPAAEAVWQGATWTWYERRPQVAGGHGALTQ